MNKLIIVHQVTLTVLCFLIVAQGAAIFIIGMIVKLYRKRISDLLFLIAKMQAERLDDDEKRDSADWWKHL